MTVSMSRQLSRAVVIAAVRSSCTSVRVSSKNNQLVVSDKKPVTDSEHSKQIKAEDGGNSLSSACANDCIFLTVPDAINNAVICKNGKKIKVSFDWTVLYNEKLKIELFVQWRFRWADKSRSGHRSYFLCLCMIFRWYKVQSLWLFVYVRSAALAAGLLTAKREQRCCAWSQWQSELWPVNSL